MKNTLVSRAASLTFVFLCLSLMCGAASRAGDASGKDIYARKCSMCHGADGTASSMWAKQGARNFNDPAWQKEMTDSALAKTISEGIPAKRMPSFKAQLTPEEIAAIIKHIRTLAPAK